MAVRRFARRRAAVAGLLALAALGGAALLTVFADPSTYAAQDLEQALRPPGPGHWMGTDPIGRDLGWRVLHGMRVSFAVTLLATALSVGIGVAYGAVAGYAGGRVDGAMMRIVDVIYGLPVIAYLILILGMIRAAHDRGYLEGAGWEEVPVYVSIGLVSWLTMARIVRGQVLALREREFVEAARALGAPEGSILFRHVLPNVLGPVAVYLTLTVPGVMLMEAFLSFLGLGIRPPKPSLGTLLSDGAQVLNGVQVDWWLIVFPAAAFGAAMLCLNAVGDGLRDALDVR
jgi:oligopeptide transport system permease protein